MFLDFVIDDYMIWVWLAVFVIAIVVEALTEELVSIWFGAGALITIPISYAAPFWVEIVVFAVISVAALIFTRPLIKKLMDRTERKTNVDEFVGKRVKVIKDVDKFDGGEIKLNGIVYTAILCEEDDVTIKKDTIVEIVALKGNRVVVRQINEESEEN
ncbi:MAG: NfeD family protein [Acholeplasmatales bacterium]|nr:NfeD family protein [Acholeplasmatales bacterium]